MKRLTLLSIALLALFAPAAASAQTGLDSIFSSSNKPAIVEDIPNEEINVAQLLRDAGYVIKKEYDDNSVLLDVERGGMTFPVAAGLTKDKNYFWMDTALNKVPSNAGDYVDKILKLLELSGSRGTSFFSYSAEYRMIHLIDSISTTNLDSATTGRVIAEALDDALAWRDAWDVTRWTQPRHVGNWTSQLNQGSLQIDLQVDGTFELVNARSGEATSISGTYTLNQEQLKMRDAFGNEFTGTIRFVDGNHFDLSLNGEELKFERS